MGERIIDMGAKLALIKCGIHGIYIKTSSSMGGDFKHREIFQPSYLVENFKSALGSGDTAIAGFLAAMIKGFKLNDCARIACASGALCCTTYDAIGAIRPIEQISMLLERPLNETMLPASHFDYNDKERLYII
jgi:sugar/nucleoside kinase (ribokinase family)